MHLATVGNTYFPDAVGLGVKCRLFNISSDTLLWFSGLERGTRQELLMGG
jgi:hypothetical protein